MSLSWMRVGWRGLDIRTETYCAARRVSLNAINRIGFGVLCQLLGIFRLLLGPAPWGTLDTGWAET